MEMFFGKYTDHVKIFTFFTIAVWILIVVYENIKRFNTRKELNELSKTSRSLSVNEFLKLRNLKKKDNKSHISSDFGFTGVYILHNQSSDLYYIGQGKNVMNRVNAHFTGKGNGDVYADYKHGDEFSIKMISLLSSGYNNLAELEKKMIENYNAYKKGYNRNRGNNFRKARY